MCIRFLISMFIFQWCESSCDNCPRGRYPVVCPTWGERVAADRLRAKVQNCCKMSLGNLWEPPPACIVRRSGAGSGEESGGNPLEFFCWSRFLLREIWVSGVSDGSDRPECSQVEWRETAQRVIEEEQQRRAELQIEQWMMYMFSKLIHLFVGHCWATFERFQPIRQFLNRKINR